MTSQQAGTKRAFGAGKSISARLTFVQESCCHLIGESRHMKSLHSIAEKIGHSKCSVLIVGESGTGKELTARLIHSKSQCKNGPFVPVDCSSLSPSLIEAELFGYVAGSFTGAFANKQGLLETANGGLLFLDEIGNLDVASQVKLLRAIQEREVKPVGSTKYVQLDVRIVAATNTDLQAAIAKGKFREDLYHRLNVVQIVVPPLRNHKSDIPALVANFLEKFAGRGEIPKHLSNQCINVFMEYDWPGNVRELQNAIECGAALSENDTINIEDLPDHFQSGNFESLQSLSLYELRRRHITRIMKLTGGNKKVAAKMLGMGKTTIYKKLSEYRRCP